MKAAIAGLLHMSVGDDVCYKVGRRYH